MAEGQGEEATSTSWAISLQKELARGSKARKEDRGKRRLMFKVPPYIKKVNPHQYDCLVLSFGLYNRKFMKLTESRMDEVRLEMVGAFFEHLNWPGPADDQWKSFCVKIVEPPHEGQEIRYIYGDDLDIRDIADEIVQSLLAIDAVFLLVFISFFGYEKLPAVGPGDDDWSRFRSAAEKTIWPILSRTGVIQFWDDISSDVWLFENQIPLILIRRVWSMVYSASPDRDAEFDNLLKHVMLSSLGSGVFESMFSTFEAELARQVSPFENCDSLLHCFHHVLSLKPRGVCATQPGRSADSSSSSSSASQVQDSTGLDLQRAEHPTAESRLLTFQVVGRFVKILRKWKMNRAIPSILRVRWNPPKSHDALNSFPTAKELQKAGIHLKGLTTHLGDIRFVKSSFLRATLYLPQISIDDESERLLRNLCVHEMFHTGRLKAVTTFVSIMDDLIDDAEDVQLLKKGDEPVIAFNGLGDDQAVARMFNTLLLNLRFGYSEELMSTLEKVYDWYSNPIRHKLTQFLVRFQERPWILLSLVAATILLTLTVMQTVYSVLSYTKD